MTHSTAAYRELVEKLFPRLTGGIRWGLERTEQLLHDAGDPHLRYRTIHVAGTNGKGSVAATIASVLTQAGHRTGLYTSPHLCSFRERIRINGLPISEDELLAVASRRWPGIEASGASFFEATTVLAFEAMAGANVDVAVVEVGLGGRLDSTNVIRPELGIITNIAFDHADYLGDTLTSIATEKAGIIKSGVPLLTAETNQEVLEVFRARARVVGAPLYGFEPTAAGVVNAEGSRCALDTNSWGHIEVKSPLIGRHQLRNLQLAVAALDHLSAGFGIGADHVRQGTRAVRWPGRFQIVQAEGSTWVFDVAHNEAGVHALRETFLLLELPKPTVLLIGILGDKDWERMLPPLFELGDQVVLSVPPTAPPNRAWNPDAVIARTRPGHAIVERDFARALARVQELATATGTILVTGSFHTVGDAQAILGWSEVEPDFPLPHKVFPG
ncbi:MAG: folylpolyglutamate synthase/dihydrofolate synthase family protein [Gemmatimonadota bacterium]